MQRLTEFSPGSKNRGGQNPARRLYPFAAFAAPRFFEAEPMVTPIFGQSLARMHSLQRGLFAGTQSISACVYTATEAARALTLGL